MDVLVSLTPREETTMRKTYEDQIKDETETLAGIVRELTEKAGRLNGPRLKYLSDKIVEHGYNIRALVEAE